MELGTTTDYIFYQLIQRLGSLCHKIIIIIIIIITAETLIILLLLVGSRKHWNQDKGTSTKTAEGDQENPTSGCGGRHSSKFPIDNDDADNNNNINNNNNN